MDDYWNLLGQRCFYTGLILNFNYMWQKQFVQRYPLLGSSVEPEKISLSVKAGAVALLPALTAVLSLFGVDAGWLSEMVNALVGIIAGVCLVWGLIRKFKKV